MRSDRGQVIVVVALLLRCGGAAQAVVMDWVTVGDPGNGADARYDATGHGSVSYTYNIGKYEVTNAQYCEFLNAVAANNDAHGLYDVKMGTPDGDLDFGGITRGGSPGSYTYSVRQNRGNAPVNYVGFWDACRFANWTHNGQGTGDTETGAYSLNGETNPPSESITRNPGALVFVPSEDEWYKAAYYKGGGTSAEYWDYPTQSDTMPTREGPPGTDSANGSANYNEAVGAPYYTADVGPYTFKPSDSPYGTFDQGGNLWEWNEGVFSGGSRGVRGGSFDNIHLHAQARSSGIPWFGYGDVGFRVAMVPEPTTLSLLALGGLAVLRRQRRRLMAK